MCARSGGIFLAFDQPCAERFKVNRLYVFLHVQSNIVVDLPICVRGLRHDAPEKDFSQTVLWQGYPEGLIFYDGFYYRNDIWAKRAL